MTASKKQKPTADIKYIYVGPNLPDSKLKKYAVFIGGLPGWLDGEFKNDVYGTALKRLFVPIDMLEESKKELLIKGKPLNQYYRTVVENI